MAITDDERILWRTMAELAEPASLGGEPMIALLDENEKLRTDELTRANVQAEFDAFQDRLEVMAKKEVNHRAKERELLEARIRELKAINADLNELLNQNDGLDVGRKLDRELEARKGATMDVEGLIKILEKADGLATKGAWHRHDDHHRKDVVHIGCPGESQFIASEVFPDDAQSINIRHNTASEVIDALHLFGRSERLLLRAMDQVRKWRGSTELLEKRIADALAKANGRFCEWGERAEMVEDILRGGDGEEKS